MSQNLVISDITRTIDAGYHVSRHSAKLTFSNQGDRDEKHFFVYILKDQAIKLSYLHILDGEKKLRVTKLDSTAEHVVFRGDLANALEPKSNVKLTVKMAFVNQLTPLPKEIAQNDQQKMLYNDNVYYYTPYKVVSQITTVSFASSSFESFTQVSPTSQRGESITWGPYPNKAALSFAAMRVHFTAHRKFLSITKLTRSLEISHWGNLAVEEHYELRNSGPSLKGNSFSRLDYQRSQNQAPTSFNNLIAKLPKSASDIYYRDRIGNISTSTSRPSRDGKYLEFDLNPRFPLFGGWKTKFYFGYNQPISQVLSNSGSAFRFMSPLGTPFEQTLIEELTLKIILPEGAKNIRVISPVAFDSESHEVTKTFLDIMGRPTIVLIKKNTVDEEHQQQIQIEYEFSTFDQLRKPLVLVGFLFIICFTIVIWNRIDLTLSKGKSVEKQEQIVLIHELVEKYVDQQLLRHDLYRSVQGSIQSGRFDATSADADRKRVEENATKITSELNAAGSDAKTYLKAIEEIEYKEKKKWDILKKIASDVAGKKQAAVSKGEEEYDEISDEIDNLLDDLKE